MGTSQLNRFLGYWALCSVLLVCLFGISRSVQLPSDPNHWWHDIIVRLPSGKPQDRVQTVIVEVPSSDWNDPSYDWQHLLSPLAPADVIALIGCPRHCTYTATHPILSTLLIGTPTAAAPATILPLGAPQRVSGRIRQWQTEPGPSLERALLDRVRPGEAWTWGNAFYLRFGKEPHIPILRAEQLAAGDIPATLLTGRVILIGAALEPGQSGYVTSLEQTTPRGMSLAELTGYAMETLLQRGTERTLTAPPMMAALALLAGLVTLLHVLFSPAVALLFGLFLSIVVFLITWLCRARWGIWLPLFDLLLAQWLSAALVLSFLLRRDERTLRLIMLEVSSRVRERLIPASALATQDSWTLAMRFTREVFDLKRQILLECLPGQQRVREIAADGYSLAQILERRRDYGRAPYTEALESGGVVRIQRRFMDLGPEEVQYMAPLKFASQLLGFWAFSVDADKAEREEEWLGVAEEARNQISELLFHQVEWRQRADPATQLLRSSGQQRALIQQLITGINLLERRLTHMEQASTGLQTAYVLYDMFGNLVHANGPMETLARTCGLKIYGCSAFELLTQLVAGDEQAARTLLNQVLLDQEMASIPVSPGQTSERDIYLYAHPVMREVDTLKQDAPGTSAQLIGVLLELVDFSLIWRLLERRQAFVASMARGVAQRVDALATSLPQPDPLVLQLQRETRILAQEAGRLRPTQQTLLVPTDIQLLLERVLSNIATAQQENQVQLDMPSLRSGCYVRSDPARLEDLLTRMLKLLLQDAFDHSWLKLTMWSTPDSKTLVIAWCGRGVGLPDDSLQHLLHGGGDEPDPHWIELMPLAAALKTLDARLRGHSTVGDTTCLEIHLPLIDREQLPDLPPRR